MRHDRTDAPTGLRSGRSSSRTNGQAGNGSPIQARKHSFKCLRNVESRGGLSRSIPALPQRLESPHLMANAGIYLSSSPSIKEKSGFAICSRPACSLFLSMTLARVSSSNKLSHYIPRQPASPHDWFRLRGSIIAMLLRLVDVPRPQDHQSIRHSLPRGCFRWSAVFSLRERELPREILRTILTAPKSLRGDLPPNWYVLDLL